MIRRVRATLYARSLEFIRDRSSLGWNLILPVILVFGLAFVFSGDGQPLFKVAIVYETAPQSAESNEIDTSLHEFLQTRHVQYLSLIHI